MKTMMMTTARIELMALTENVREFKNQLHPDVIIDAKLVVTLPSGKKVELDACENINFDWEQFDAETGIEVYSEDEYQ